MAENKGPNMKKTYTEALDTQVSCKQRDALLTGKQHEALLELNANKSTFHTCICFVSLQHSWHTHVAKYTGDRKGKKEGQHCLKATT